MEITPAPINRHKKEGKIAPLAGTWMGLQNIMVCEISQTEKGKHISLTCGALRNNTNESVYKTQKRENNPTVSKGEKNWRRDKLGIKDEQI